MSKIIWILIEIVLAVVAVGLLLLKLGTMLD